MNNQYIFDPKIDIDLEQIVAISKRQMQRPVTGLASHQRRIADEPYLVEVQQKYPFLSNLYNLYTSPPDWVIPIHICPNRGCALNIPVQYTEDSHTVFYEIPTDAEKEYSEERIYELIKSDAVEVFRYTLDRPVIMNTLLPHGVFGGPKMWRTIFSWSITTSYEETRKLVG
jgi:hypothetical protein